MTDAPPTLDYGRPAARWPLRRVLLLFVAIGLVGTGVWAAGRWYWPQLRGFLDQRAVEAVAAPPGAVLYSEDPADVARLTGQTQYELSRSQNNPPAPAVERVSEWFTSPDQPNARFRSGMPPIGLRRAPGGPWRLININGGQYGSQPDGSRNFMFPVFDVDTRVTPWPGSRHRQLWYGINRLVIAPSDRMTLRAGRLDSLDDAHFTFDYALNGTPGTVDGRLNADDSLTFTIRTGPATTRPFKHGGARQNFP